MIFIFNIEFLSAVLKKHTGQVIWLPVVAARSVYILPMSVFLLFAILMLSPPTLGDERLLFSGLPFGRLCVVRPSAVIPREPISLYLMAGFR